MMYLYQGKKYGEKSLIKAIRDKNGKVAGIPSAHLVVYPYGCSPMDKLVAYSPFFSGGSAQFIILNDLTLKPMVQL